jgi:hypothetical protein
MLDTQEANFRRALDDGEREEFFDYFESVTDIFRFAQDPEVCQIDHSKGSLIFSVTFTVGKEKKRKNFQLCLAKLERVNDLYKMELMFRKVARRQYLSEKGTRE